MVGGKRKRILTVRLEYIVPNEPPDLTAAGYIVNF